jgi:hypothetical protein
MDSIGGATVTTRAKVSADKVKHPERFCPVQGCLWKTTKLNHATQQHEGGGFCPRHKKVESADRSWKNMFNEDAWTAKDSGSESTEGRYGQ